MKIEWTTSTCVPLEELYSNVRHAKSLNLPGLSQKRRPPLAIVGGGPSLPSHLDTLRNWSGDVWACGSPYPWCVENGIDAVFFNIDPLTETIGLARGAKKAILSTTNHPGVFDVVESVEVFDLIDEGEGFRHGATTATAVPHVAAYMGYSDVTFFGCESSFPEGKTHAYKHEDWELHIAVMCNGERFVTKPQLLFQADLLSQVIRGCPSCKEASGGLLRAMVANPEYDIVAGNKAAHDRVNRKVKLVSDYGSFEVSSWEAEQYIKEGWQVQGA